MQRLSPRLSPSPSYRVAVTSPEWHARTSLVSLRPRVIRPTMRFSDLRSRCVPDPLFHYSTSPTRRGLHAPVVALRPSSPKHLSPSFSGIWPRPPKGFQCVLGIRAGSLTSDTNCPRCLALRRFAFLGSSHFLSWPSTTLLFFLSWRLRLPLILTSFSLTALRFQFSPHEFSLLPPRLILPASLPAPPCIYSPPISPGPCRCRDPSSYLPAVSMRLISSCYSIPYGA